MSDSSHKRRNYFIKKGFQLKYTLSIALTLLVVMLVSSVGLYLGMWGSIIENFSKFEVSQNLENVRRIADLEEARYRKGDYRLQKIFREAELLSEKEKETLNSALKSVNMSLIPKVLALTFFIFLGGIFLSHKIAGPMYRIEKSAEAIRNGDLRVNFHTRKTDEIKETTSVLEDMVESLHKDIKRLKELTAELEKGQPQIGIIKEINNLLSKYKT